jgi:tRNA(Ile)-lysidine synthase
VAGQFVREAVKSSGDRVEIDRERIRQLPSARMLLYTVLQQYGFNYDTVDNLVETLDGQPGRQFLSGTHELTVDRSVLIIQPLRPVEEKEKETEIGEGTAAMQIPVNLTFRLFSNAESCDIPGDGAIASLDRDRITYPLKIRRWRKGDYFCPLGMKGRKKLSDFFADEKIPLPDKKRLWILESAGNIVWVIGLRIDHRYRVTPVTRNILQILYRPGNEEEKL